MLRGWFADGGRKRAGKSGPRQPGAAGYVHDSGGGIFGKHLVDQGKQAPAVGGQRVGSAGGGGKGPGDLHEGPVEHLIICSTHTASKVEQRQQRGDAGSMRGSGNHRGYLANCREDPLDGRRQDQINPGETPAITLGGQPITMVRGNDRHKERAGRTGILDAGDQVMEAPFASQRILQRYRWSLRITSTTSAVPIVIAAGQAFVIAAK